MKLRIRGNSLRLRVSRSEIARLLEGHCLEETIHFAPEESARFSEQYFFMIVCLMMSSDGVSQFTVIVCAAKL
jgi:hypothetical protein